MNISVYRELADYTLGNKKADLCFKNANVVLVQTGEIVKADVAVSKGYIVGVGDYSGNIEVDCSDKFIAPGFIDSHLHFESTMTRPSELVYYASRCGTTTYIADPHEAGNVSGIRGIEYILEDTKNCSGDVYIMMPSCVPSKDSEDSGHIIEAEDMLKLLDNDRILGLGEVMDCESVINRSASMMDKLKLFESKHMDGHALGLKDKSLATYIMSGIKTDHECSTYDDAINKVRNGMYVQIREGSAAKNLENIVSGIIKNKVDTSRFTFCTDDKHVEDIKTEGHISYNIKKSITLGMDVVEAYKIASYNPAICYDLKEVGMISVGKKANLVILDDLKKVSISDVYYNGKKVDEFNFDKVSHNKYEKELSDTVHIDWFDESMLELIEKKVAISLVDRELLTKKVNREDGVGYENKVIVIERHHNTRKYHSVSCFNFGIRNGAIATSVSHDSHNVVVIGDNDRDILLAVETLKNTNGACVLVSKGEVYDYLSLSIMGLICPEDSNVISKKIHRMTEKAYEMGVNKKIDPFITLSFIALPVIPEVRITTNGIWSV